MLGAGGSPAATLDDAVTRLLGLEFDGLVCVVSLGPVAEAEAVAPAAVLPGAPAPPSSAAQRCLLGLLISSKITNIMMLQILRFSKMKAMGKCAARILT